MKEMIVIYGPQGCGKTISANLLANHYGANKIADGFMPSRSQKGISDDDVILVLLNERPCNVMDSNLTVRSFHEALHEINAHCSIVTHLDCA